MKTATIEIYAFEELSEKAKKRALNDFRDVAEYSWHDENTKSVKAFCAKFKVQLIDCRLNAYGRFHFEHDADNSNFRGVKLKDIEPSESLTGYCLDGELLAAFKEAATNNGGDMLAAFNDAVVAGFNAWQHDYEYHYTDENIKELIIINEYDFTADGKIWSGISC